ncbi:MAG: glycosyltransferase family 4 protein [Bacteroidia bacterium]|nr:glycosyltransferase family 4 protein [Bacteroidia bacterium]
MDKKNRLSVQQNKYLLFSTDFKPMDGGLADYAFQLANHLHKENKLECVINFAKESNFDFQSKKSVIASIERNLGKKIGDNLQFIRRLNTFLHYLKLYFFSLKELYPYKFKNIDLLAVSCYGYKQLIYINAARILRFKYKIVLHGLDIITNKSVWSLFEKVVKGSNEIICNSNATKELLVSKKTSCLNQKITIQHPVLDKAYIEALNALPLAYFENKWQIELEKRILIVSITRLVKRKGINIAIDAVTELLKKGYKITYIIGGKGAEFENLKSQIDINNLTQYIRLVGFVSDEEKFSLLHYSDLFLLPTRSLNNSDFEGFGISFIEASYKRNIVIGGVHGGVPEAIKHEVSGFTLNFDAANATNELENLLIKLIKLKDLNYLKEQGYNYVNDNYTTLKLQL